MAANARVKDADSPGPHVLIVDDDPTTRETMSLVLSVAEFHVHEASDASAAIATAQMRRLDLSLLDQRMDGMTGLQLAKRFRDDGIYVPWILYSGFMDYELAREAGRLGAVRAIGMPFDVEAVVMGALEHLQRRKDAAWPPRRWSRGVLDLERLRRQRRPLYDSHMGPSCPRDREPAPRCLQATAHSTERSARLYARPACPVVRGRTRRRSRRRAHPWRSADDGRPLEPRKSESATVWRVCDIRGIYAHQRFTEKEHPLVQALRSMWAKL